MTLVPLGADVSGLAVSDYLDRARAWLATAVELTGPAEIAAAKAEIATAAEATKQLNLSKEIQLDAVEMVRRAEYALGKAIRKGQAEGTVRRRGERSPGNQYGLVADPVDNGICKASVYDFASSDELTGNSAGIYDLVDGVDVEQFEAAIDDAKAEGNLSRANVVRKVKGQRSTRPSRIEKAALLADLAGQGYSSRQMCERLGFSTDAQVRDLAREHGIEIPADRSVNKTRRIDSTRVVVNTATALEGLVAGVALIDYDAVDVTEARQWATSLTDSLRVLNRFQKRIKELTQ